MASRKPLVQDKTTARQTELPSTDLIDPTALGTGSASSSTFLRGDQTWATPSGGSSASAWSDAPIALWGDVDLLTPGANTLTSLGLTASSPGTLTIGSLTMSGGTYRQSLHRVTISTGTTTGTAAGTRLTQFTRWRGNAAGLGGFDVIVRFGLTLLTGHQAMIGLVNTTVLTGEPSAVGSIICLGADSGDTNLQWMSNSGGATTKTDTGLSKLTLAALRVRLTAQPNAASIAVSLWNEETSSSVSSLTLSSNLPGSTTGLLPFAQVRNGTTTTNAAIDIMRLYSAAPSN